MSYRPETAAFRSFAAARARFSPDYGPRDFLEECLAALEGQEGAVKAFVSFDLIAARAAADAAADRWRQGRPLSELDGLPFAVKDCFDVAGLPTRVNSPVFDNASPAAFDAAHVAALRAAGAYVLGKTVTTEFTMALPGPTRNPWNTDHTPGGSSSGSAAAVAAGMLPLATGSQVRGSVIRPASICGVPGYKPTFGALNVQGGVDPSPGLNHLGLLGATFRDIWESASIIARGVGGDPGYRPFRPGPFPEPKQPTRLARQYTIGWEKTDARSKAAFEDWLSHLQDAGVEIVEPEASPEFAAYEAATARAQEFFFDLFWEIRWPWLAVRQAHPAQFSHVMHRHLDSAAALTLDDYRAALDRRDALRALHRALSGKVDGFVTLAHIGPGQHGDPEVGTPWYNDASSAVGAPTVNLPVLSVDGLPLGVQLMGFEHEDAALFPVAQHLMSLL
ncbi:amidase family protein [Amorphus sp. 3PC139-8]|uniref:amidase family protein n=1 Tax=Amorphus sp. 3PC139-8 TaxID=2735676 RepID=UPI00345D7E57